jgi:formiminoglutamate deiminase
VSAVTAYVCDLAFVAGATDAGGVLAADVVVEVEEGRFTRVEVGGEVPPGAEHLRGLVLPGLADAHSHAFHRALRGRTHGGRGTFWSWREVMYDVAGRLTPDTYLPLARAAFAESVLAGTTTIGEFHYLHHQPDGSPYADPNELGHTLVQAAREAGVRLALLDTCYLTGGFDRSLEGVQRRFGDGDASAWADRVEALRQAYAVADDLVVGAAAHSVRAVPAEQLPVVAGWARSHEAPLHAHLSEQPAENADCLAAHGRTPTELLEEAGALGQRTTAVHATHLTSEDIAALGASGTTACLCPTTERDLADGIGPARELLDAGALLSLGSDSRAIVAPFEEARAAELHLRLRTLERGNLTVPELTAALTTDGHRSLGFADAGRLAVGARADLVAVQLDSIRTAGIDAADAIAGVIFAAGAADVTDVVVDGRPVVRDGEHHLGDVGRLLDEAIAAVHEEG